MLSEPGPQEPCTVFSTAFVLSGTDLPFFHFVKNVLLLKHLKVDKITWGHFLNFFLKRGTPLADGLFGGKEGRGTFI
jgi:hypothetical protein